MLIRTKKAVDELLEQAGVERRKIPFVYCAASDDGMSHTFLWSGSLWHSPSDPNNKTAVAFHFPCPVCAIRYTVTDETVGGEILAERFFQPGNVARPFEVEDTLVQNHINVDRSKREFEVDFEGHFMWEGRRFSPLIQVAGIMRCPYCPDAKDGRRMEAVFTKPGVLVQIPTSRIWPAKASHVVAA